MDSARSVRELLERVQSRLGVRVQGSDGSEDATERSGGIDAPLIRWRPERDDRPVMLLCVSTFNRLDYLQDLLTSFMATRCRDFFWVVGVADDGSCDGTRDYIRNLRLEDVLVVPVFNRGAGIAGQTNSLLALADSVEFVCGFKCDDDVIFKKPGWDVGYYEAIRGSGFDHLVFFDPGWKSSVHTYRRPGLISRTDLENCLGAFWTFTPRVLARVGYFDEHNFPFRGHSHLDYTARACRQGFNELERVWDWEGSVDHLALRAREDYRGTVDWEDSLVKEILSPEERARRWSVVRDPERRYLPYRPHLEGHPAPLVEPQDLPMELLAALWLRGFDVAGLGQIELYDEGVVVNLDHQIGRWMDTAARLSKDGLAFRRFPATNGYAPSEMRAWQEYAAEGLLFPHERRIGRRLIQSPGAWGYLSTARRVVDWCKANRIRRLAWFDDDVILRQDFRDALYKVANSVPDDWVLFYLGASYDEPETIERVSEDVVDPGPTVNGSFALFIDTKAFDIIADECEKRQAPLDAGALRQVRERFPGRVFAARPELAIADVSSSSIRDKRDPHEFASKMGWALDRYPTLARTRDREELVVLVDAIGARTSDLCRTVQSLRYQTYGWFRAFVVVEGDADVLRRVVSQLRASDSRVSVFAVRGAGEDMTGVGGIAELIGRRKVTRLRAGDVVTPNHLEELSRLSASDSDVIAVPLGVFAPSDSQAGGQLGWRWEDVIQGVVSRYTVGEYFGGALLGHEVIEEFGDLYALDEGQLRALLQRELSGRLIAASAPTLVLRGQNRREPSVDTSVPTRLYLDAGRQLDVCLLKGAI